MVTDSRMFSYLLWYYNLGECSIFLFSQVFINTISLSLSEKCYFAFGKPLLRKTVIYNSICDDCRTVDSTHSCWITEITVKNVMNYETIIDRSNNYRVGQQSKSACTAKVFKLNHAINELTSEVYHLAPNLVLSLHPQGSHLRVCRHWSSLIP